MQAKLRAREKQMRTDGKPLGIFEGIDEKERSCMIACFSGREQSFAEGAVLADYSEESDQIGILLKGRADVVRIGGTGEKTLLEHLQEGEPFGRPLYLTTESIGDLVTVTATEDCRVLFLNYHRVLQRCENNCPHHAKLEQNLMGIILRKVQRLSERVEVLSRRSIREKLLCYFSMQQVNEGESFALPFSLSRLAEYISVDRSAMMRELKKMKDENFVTVDHGRVTLMKTLY